MIFNYQNILVDVASNIATITINRPKALNALNGSTIAELGDFFSSGFKSIDKLNGVLIQGAGDKAFIAGADIKGFTGLTKSEAKALSQQGMEVFDTIENFHIPTIAIIDGFALGGGLELAMSCHIRIATDKSKFGQPEVNLGIIPGYGATQRLTQLIGKSKSFELHLTADLIDASLALRLGLINHKFDSKKEALEKGIKIISKVSTKGPIAVKNVIKAINACFDESINGFELESALFGECAASEDFEEGVNAFISKRKAIFKNL